MFLNCGVGEDSFESPLDCKEIKPVHPKGNQSWIFIRRTDAEAETPIHWPPDEELIHWKRPWCWERLKVGEGDDRRWDGWMASPTPWTWVWVSSGVADGQGKLACCSPCCSPVHKESDTTERLNWTEGWRNLGLAFPLPPTANSFASETDCHPAATAGTQPWGSQLVLGPIQVFSSLYYMWFLYWVLHVRSS